MAYFHDIKELLRTMSNNAKLLGEIFDKRKTVAIDYYDAIDMLDGDEPKLQNLIAKGIIESAGEKLELTDTYMRFFEEVLEVNEIINVAMVQEYIGRLKGSVADCLVADSSERKMKIMREMRHTFLNIERATKRNLIDLKRNAENTYKQEPNFRIKKMHLERLDEKRRQIATLIIQTERLIDAEDDFLSRKADDALRQAVAEVKRGLHESARSLIDTENQIIDYLNKIEYQSRMVKKVRQLKYLKDQQMMKAYTNTEEVLMGNNALWLEAREYRPTKLSLSFLHNEDDAMSIITDVRRQVNRKANIQQRLSPPLRQEDMEMQQEVQRVFNHQELMNGFEAQGKDLFTYVWQYNFSEEVDKEQRLVLFLQLASQYADRLLIADRSESIDNITYPIIHIKG